MHSHSIEDLWDLPQLHIVTTEKEERRIFIEAIPVDHIQPCPICGSNQIIRRGTAYIRTVRHLDAFGRQVYVQVPAIRLSCKECTASFVWVYDFVDPKKQYTKAFEAILPKQAIRSTITHTAHVMEIPASTATRVMRAWKTKDAAQIQQTCQEQAEQCQTLSSA